MLTSIFCNSLHIIFFLNFNRGQSIPAVVQYASVNPEYLSAGDGRIFISRLRL